MNAMGFVWLGITAAAAVIEAAVPALVSIWFVPGGLAALVANLAGGPLWLQIGLFVLGVLAAMAVTRPLARRLQKEGPPPTNADRALGSTGVVTERIDNLLGTGRVAVLGNSWAARAVAQDETIAAGETVVVARIEGVKLLVSRAAEKGENL